MEIKPGYTRVTEILGQWNKYDGIDPFVLANKASIGTMVHSQIEASENGSSLEDLPNSCKGFFDSYKQWRKSFPYPFTHQETRLYNEALKITGQFDAIVAIPESQTKHLIDFKCTAQADHKIWPLQAAFYWLLAKENGIELSKVCYFIKLDKEGYMPTVITYIIDEDKIKIAMAAYQTYKYLNT